MSADVGISFIAFACIFGCALLAMFIGRALPEDHLSGDF